MSDLGVCEDITTSRDTIDPNCLSKVESKCGVSEAGKPATAVDYFTITFCACVWPCFRDLILIAMMMLVQYGSSYVPY